MTDQQRPRRSRTANQSSGVARGRAAFAKVQDDTAKEKQQREVRNSAPRQTYRFKLKQPKAGDAPTIGMVTILDHSVDDLAFIKEHEIWANGKPNFDICINETGNCPNCDGRNLENLNDYDKPKYHSNIMMLSVVHNHPKDPYVRNDGSKLTHARKLLAVKQNQMEDIIDILEEAEEKYGTIRGVTLKMKREMGSGIDQPAIGKPQKGISPKAPHKKFAKYSEQQLVDKFGHQQVVDDKGTVIQPANQTITACDYEKEFVALTEAQLCAKWGIPAPSNDEYTQSRSTSNEDEFEDEFDETGNPVSDLGSDDDIPMDEEVPWDGEEEPVKKVDENGFSEDDFEDDDVGLD